MTFHFLFLLFILLFYPSDFKIRNKDTIFSLYKQVICSEPLPRSYNLDEKIREVRQSEQRDRKVKDYFNHVLGEVLPNV